MKFGLHTRELKSGVERDLRKKHPDLNVALLQSHFEEVYNQFEEFIQRTNRSLLQYEAQTRQDLMGDTSHNSFFAAIRICVGINCLGIQLNKYD